MRKETTETVGTTEITEKFIVILMILCFAVVSFVSVVSVVSKKNSPSTTTQISCQKAADTTLGKNPDDGLYLRYCSLSGLFVSGSRCLPY
ncbi:MAG: hypothetical protein IKJ08_07610, partial [Alistipes sp.]|nr:hypothetical protein [Alistipes sp.]